MPDEQRESKTEPATPRHREEARKKGKVARSTEIGMAVVLLAVVLVLWVGGAAMRQSFCAIFRSTLGGLTRTPLDPPRAVQLLSNILLSAASIGAPIFLAVVVVSLFSGFVQVGFRITPESIRPKFEKFNPIMGFKKFLSLRSLMTLFTSTVKLSVLLVVGYLTIRAYLPSIMGLYRATPAGMLATVSHATLDFGLRAALVLMVIAAIDYAYQKWQYERDMKMTKEQVKEEHKLVEGNPETESRIRRMQIALARRRMLNNVKDADVVVRNPTHYAVALKYDPAKASAPVALAKGAGYLARRIIELARKHGVPMVHDAPVAQMLYKTVEVGQEIPPKLYRAVARLLVHIYKRYGRQLPGMK